MRERARESERAIRPAVDAPARRAPGSPAAVLALQRSAGNQAVAQAIAARRSLQRWKVLAQRDGAEDVTMEPGDVKPTVPLGPGRLATQPFDGYEYEIVGEMGGGTLYRRRLRSHQNNPAVQEPRRARTQAHYGTFWEDPSVGGMVTPNPSPYFAQQAALDFGSYAVNASSVSLADLLQHGYRGAGRMIDGSDVESLLDSFQLGVAKLAKDVGDEATARGATIASKLRSLFDGGDGTKLVEEREVRTRLQDDIDDPRVIHYLLLHSRGSLSRSGLSFVVSKLTLGISASVEKGGSAIAQGGLGAALSSVVTEMQRANHEVQSSDTPKPNPPDLIDAIDALAVHFGATTVVEAMKAIPFYVGTVVGAVQSASRAMFGSIDGVKRACAVIRDYLKRRHPSAIKVVGLLGVPEEVVTAKGGEKALMTRL